MIKSARDQIIIAPTVYNSRRSLRLHYNVKTPDKDLWILYQLSEAKLGGLYFLETQVHIQVHSKQKYVNIVYIQYIYTVTVIP